MSPLTTRHREGRCSAELTGCGVLPPAGGPVEEVKVALDLIYVFLQ